MQKFYRARHSTTGKIGVMGIRYDTRKHKGVIAEGVCGTYKPAHCCSYAESSSYSIFNEGDTFLSSEA